jgi:hypothetical protein
LDISLLKDRRHGLFRRSAGLQELGEARVLAQIRDHHVDPPGAGLPGSGPITAAVVHTVVAAFVRPGAAQLVDIQRHEAVGREPEHLGKQVDVGCLRQKRAQRRGL